MYTQTRESIRTPDDTFYEYIVRVVGNILKFTRLDRVRNVWNKREDIYR